MDSLHGPRLGVYWWLLCSVLVLLGLAAGLWLVGLVAFWYGSIAGWSPATQRASYLPLAAVLVMFPAQYLARRLERWIRRRIRAEERASGRISVQ